LEDRREIVRSTTETRRRAAMRSLKTAVGDIDLRDAILAELDWDPSVDHSKIHVTVKDGAVSLRGRVTSYSQRHAAVRAAERVRGVKAVADDIEVVLSDLVERKDSEIAEEIALERQGNAWIPPSVKVEVRNGKVTLRGYVPWSYQRDEAARAIRDLAGVRAVSNLIEVEPPADRNADDIEERIEQAISRTADLDANSISVTKDNGVIRLEGSVGSLAERRTAQRVAESAPGVKEVENDIVIN
jgi:osmotically-inducible protein OsmY